MQDCMGWQTGQIGKTFCHQVGRAHRKLLLDALGLNPAIDFSTFETLGNTGSVALPITAAMGIEQGHVRPGERVAMLGIGSGINAVVLGVQWQ
jgi:3-oxoacyl-[acyl-carrier-protein] synthase-3